MTIKVRLRQKEVSGNRLSLYLDIYPPILNKKTGKLSRREFLHEFIHAPLSYKRKKTKHGIEYVPVYPAEHETSILNTLAKAEAIRQKRENELSKPEIYNAIEREQLRKNKAGEENFVDYFKVLAEKRTGLNHDNWIAASKYLEKFTAGKLIMTEINESKCNDFKNYLLTTKSNKSIKSNLSVNSAASYFNKFKAALKQAFKDGLLQTDINGTVQSIKEQSSNRSFLTKEELNKLVKTECNNPLLKKAALFSALTGLRFSDIQKLKWKELVYSKEQGYYISYTQKKTKEPETLNISEQAYKLLGEPGEPDARVFDGLEYSAYANKHLYQWIGAAGITKNITFHSFRHTRATLLLSEGVDLFVISKILGHKNIKTTQVYTHVMDKAKKEAADKGKIDL
jgi:integrase